MVSDTLLYPILSKAKREGTVGGLGKVEGIVFFKFFLCYLAVYLLGKNSLPS